MPEGQTPGRSADHFLRASMSAPVGGFRMGGGRFANFAPGSAHCPLQGDALLLRDCTSGSVFAVSASRSWQGRWEASHGSARRQVSSLSKGCDGQPPSALRRPARPCSGGGMCSGRFTRPRRLSQGKADYWRGEPRKIGCCKIRPATHCSRIVLRASFAGDRAKLDFSGSQLSLAEFFF